MTAQKGKDLLLKVDTNGPGSFVTVAGLRARTLAFNAATVDVLRRSRCEPASAPNHQVHQDKMSICVPFMRGSWKLK